MLRRDISVEETAEGTEEITYPIESAISQILRHPAESVFVATDILTEPERQQVRFVRHF